MVGTDGSTKYLRGFAITYDASTVRAGAIGSNGISSVPAMNTVTNVIAKTGATNTIQFTVKDQYGTPQQWYTVTATLTGRNAAVTVAQAITDAAGLATISYTDASTSTTSLTDNLTFAVTAPGAGSDLATGSDSLAINYSASGSYATLTLSGGSTAAATVSVYPQTADGDVTNQVTISNVLKDSLGATITGVGITYTGSAGVYFRTVAGKATRTTGGDLTTITAGSGTGIVAYGTKPGVATVTATGGGLTATQTFTVLASKQARKVAVTASGNKFTAVVTDGFGNPISGVTLSFATTSQGVFGGGVTSTSAVTDTTGSATAIVNSADGKAGDVTVSVTLSSAGSNNNETTSLADSPVTGFADGAASASAKGAVTAVTTTATTDAATTSKINDIATAVANLSTTVAGLVASLVAQIKDTKAAIADTKAALDALAAVVAKIQKKVKA